MKMFPVAIKILPVIALFLLAFPFLSANAATYPASERDSIYLYYALENQASIDEMLASKDIALLLEEDESLRESLPIWIRSSYFDRKSELLDPADFEIALNELTEKQTFAMKDAEEAINKVSKKTELGTILLGNNLGTLEFQLVQIKGLQALLNSLIPKTTDVTIKMQIRDQIYILKEEQKKIETLLYEKENDFSLFGWLVAAI